jgi:hypothetical protein
MRPYQTFITLVVLVLVAAGAFAALAAGQMGRVVSAVLLFLLYTGPFLSGEVLYDVFDKVIDRWLYPEVKIAVWVHIFIALLLAVIFLAIWPTMTITITTAANLEVGRWLTYIRFPDNSLVAFGYPKYAWDMGLLAFFTLLLGYAYEPLQLRWLSRRRNKRI